VVELTLTMNLILPLRIVQTILSIIVLGLVGYCVDVVGGNYSEASFLVFVCIWTWLVLLYMVLTPMYFPDFHNRWVVVGLESVTMIFWFAGFVAIADSTKASRFVCFGSGCRALECAKAAAVFGAFSWLAWLATMGLIIDALLKYRKGEHAVDPDAGNYYSSDTSKSRSRSRSRSRARSRSRKPHKARRKSSRSTSSSPPPPSEIIAPPPLAHKNPFRGDDQNIEMPQKQQQNHEPAGPQPPRAVYGHPPPPRSGIPTPEPADFGGVE